MKVRSRILALISLFGLLHATPSAAAVEYVRICSLFGASYFYSPGTDSCINAITGEVKTQTAFGLMRRQTYFTARVRALESDYCDRCFAAVRANGAIAHSEQVTGATRVGVGRFEVQFAKPVTQCAVNATLGSPDANGSQQLPGVITVGRAPNATNTGVSVWTYNMSGNLSDRAFHLSLDCQHKAPFSTVTDNVGTHECTAEELAGVTGLGPPGP
jgi:hypothetical protein